MIGGKFASLKWVKPKAKALGDRERLFRATSIVGHALWDEALELGFPRAGKVTKSARDQAEELLGAAAEIEQALLAQYLYAAYSIDPTGPAKHLRDVVIEIAIEEMGHLITVQNLLCAIGAPPYFDRESVPLTGNKAGKNPFPIKFEPLSGDSLAKYVTAESMPLKYIDDASLRKELRPIFARGQKSSGGAVDHVGLLYAKIFWLFQRDDAQSPFWPGLPVDMLPSGWHVTDDELKDGIKSQRQVTPEEFGQTPITPASVPAQAVYVIEIRSRDDALFALAQIARQGEGYQPGIDSHFARFFEGYKDFAATFPKGILPVPVNPNTASKKISGPAEEGRITNPKAVRWARLFDIRYQLLLLELWLGVSTEPSATGPLARANLLDAALVEMTERIGHIAADLLPSMDLKEVATKAKAGAPFSMPDKPLPKTPEGVKARMKERFDFAESLAVEIEQLPAPDAPSADEAAVLKAMRNADKPFKTAVAKP